MLAPVTGLAQTGQVPPQTSFGWDPDLDADFYLVGVDSATPVQVGAPAATVTAPAGAHSISVAPGVNDPAPTTLAFNVPGPPPPPPAQGNALLPLALGAAAIGGVIAVAAHKRSQR